MENILVRLFGYIATVFHGDTSVFDRWIWLKKNISSGHKKTLDAGCGSGAYTMFAGKIGNDAIGISFNERNNKIATKRAENLKIHNVKFIQGDLRKLDEMSDGLGKFDQIICFETIEHIINDKKLVKDFYTLLNSEGKILVTVPYRYSHPLYGEKNEKFSTYEDGGHVRPGYTHEEMSDLLKGAGFEIIKQDYVTGFISQQLINLTRAISEVNSKLAWIVVLPLRIFMILDPLIYRIFKYAPLSIAVVAKK